MELGRCSSKTDLASCRELLVAVPWCALGSLKCTSHEQPKRALCLSQPTATAVRGWVPRVQGRVAASQGHGWTEVTSLGSTARRHPLVCFLLEEEAELTSLFQAGSQLGIISVFPVENQWVLAKLNFST